MCSWFPLSNRSLAEAQGLQIPARRRGSCVQVCVHPNTCAGEQDPKETTVPLLYFTLTMYTAIDYTLRQKKLNDT